MKFRLICLLLFLTFTACGQDASAAKYAQTFETLLTAQRAGGVTLAGGKVYFYVPGTTTLKAVYTDRLKTTPAANPATLDANGTIQIFGDGLYDIKVTNSAGDQKFFWEDVLIQSSASALAALSDYSNSLATAVTSIGATKTTLLIDVDNTVSTDVTVPATLEIVPTNGAVTTVNTGKTLTIANPNFNPGPIKVFAGLGTVVFTNKTIPAYPQWWGALGDGSNDDTTAIASALAATYVTIIPPVAVEYKITSTLEIPAGQMVDGLSVASIITQYTDNTPIFKITGMEYELKNLVLQYKNQQTAANTGAVAVVLGDTNKGAYEGHISNLSIKKPYRGIMISTATGAFAYENRIEGVRVYNAADWAFHFAGNGTVGLTTNTLLNCFAVQDTVSPTTTGAGFYAANHDEIVFINCACDRAPVGYAFNISNTAHAVLIGPHGEYNKVVDYGALIKLEDSSAFITGANFIETIVNVAHDAAVVQVVGTSRGSVEIVGLTERDSTLTAGTFYGISAASTSANVAVNAKGFFSSLTNYDALISGLPQIKSFNNLAGFNSLSIGGGTAITKHLSGTATWDPPSLAVGAATSVDVTVTGAALGDTAIVGFTTTMAPGAVLTARASATNTVTVNLHNLSVDVLDAASGTLRVDVWKH